jgi:hypothetical protein
MNNAVKHTAFLGTPRAYPENSKILIRLGMKNQY